MLTKKIINSFTQAVVFILVSFIILNCEKNPLKVASEEDVIIKGKGIYALKGNQNYFGCDLYYSNYDSITFKKIEGCYDLLCLHINKKNNLLIGASQNKLLFVNTLTNKKITEINVPDTENPAPYFSLTEIHLFPYPLNPDYCILCNWSVYLVNLKTLSLEKIFWNARNSDKIIYTHGAVLSDDGKSLYLMLTLLGVWQEGEYWRYEARQRLSKLDLKTGQIYTIYDYPVEKAPGAKFVFCNKDYIISYDLNRSSMIRFLVSSGALVDSFMVTINNYLTFPYTNGDHIILQDGKNGSFYKLYPEKKKLKLYMQFLYQDFRITTYQETKGGEVYACMAQTSDGTSLIINLSQKEIVREFKSDSLYSMSLKEDEQ